jgi:hypothetical protein
MSTTRSMPNEAVERLPAGQLEGNPTTHEKADQMNHGMDVIEWAEFSLKPSASEADMLALAPAVTDWLRAQPGFRARRLSKGPDGRWADCCFCADMATARAAADAIEAAPETRPFLDLLDWKVVSVRHFATALLAE